MTAQDGPILITERLVLKVPSEAAESAVFKIHSDTRTYEHRPDLVMKTREEATALRKQWQQNWADDGIGYFVVSRKPEEDNEVKEDKDTSIIGFCGVRKSVEKDVSVLNVYYRFSPESQGKGFAKEATAAAIEWGCKKYPALPVVAIIDPINAASIRLAKKLGFTLDAASGVPGDYDVYRL